MSLLCPRCLINPSRITRQKALVGHRTAYCESCRVETRREHTLATTARRKAAREAARAAGPQPMCPRCGVNPPRYFQHRPGTVPLCAPCRQVGKDRKLAVQAESRSRVVSFTSVTAGDIPPAEIERRFEAALLQIRKRA